MVSKSGAPEGAWYEPSSVHSLRQLLIRLEKTAVLTLVKFVITSEGSTGAASAGKDELLAPEGAIPRSDGDWTISVTGNVAVCVPSSGGLMAAWLAKEDVVSGTSKPV